MGTSLEAKGCWDTELFLVPLPTPSPEHIFGRWKVDGVSLSSTGWSLTASQSSAGHVSSGTRQLRARARFCVFFGWEGTIVLAGWGTLGAVFIMLSIKSLGLQACFQIYLNRPESSLILDE